MTQKRRVLFFAEPATLAHVVRPVVLAGALDADKYEVCIATGGDFRHHVEGAGLPVRDLWCIGTRAYLSAVAAGRPVFPYSVLLRYVEEDLRVIDDFRPDLIVGDFRLSLAVSARLSRTPYISVSNAYWSPYASARFEVPVHAATRLLGVSVANAVFSMIRPLIFAQHSMPMRRLCTKHGLPSSGVDLRRVFTEGDLTVFADVPEMVPTEGSGLDARYRYIGPITWSPSTKVPDSLIGPADARPLVYISLGSSGDESALDTIVRAVLSAGCRVVVGAGGTRWAGTDNHSVVVGNILPGAAIAAMARLVICNGGSPAAHQALQQGTPVLGIPANLDQLLNMDFVVRSGAGLALRADRLSTDRVRALVQRMLQDDAFRERAETVRRWFGKFHTEQRFADVVTEVADRGWSTSARG